MSGHTDDCIFKTTGYCDCGWWNEIGAYVPEDKDALIERLQKELGEALNAVGIMTMRSGMHAEGRDTIRQQTIEECARVAEEHAITNYLEDTPYIKGFHEGQNATVSVIAKAIRSLDGGGK